MRPSVLMTVLMTTGLLAACGSNEGGTEGGSPSPAESAALSGAPPMDADGLPVFREGLWLHSETREGETTIFHVCQGAGSDENLRDILSGERPGCQINRSTDRGALELSIQCPLQDGQIQTTVRITGEEAAYRARMDTTITSAGQVQARDTGVTEARWLSDCPADMEPGDEREVTP